MGAEVALLGGVIVGVDEDGVIRAGGDACLAADADPFVEVDDAVRPAVHRSGRAGRRRTVPARTGCTASPERPAGRSGRSRRRRTSRRCGSPRAAPRSPTCTLSCRRGSRCSGSDPGPSTHRGATDVVLARSHPYGPISMRMRLLPFPWTRSSRRGCARPRRFGGHECRRRPACRARRCPRPAARSPTGV